ncbi:MAG: flagellar basal body rod protein FlgB [Opitutales bacterium]|nr:flagellar basal body rod protein FlgB [Opitutales bacterium]
MLDAIFSGTNYVAAKQMLDAAQVRHQAITSNIANVDTPGYQRVDLRDDFQAELNRLVANGDTNAIRRLEAETAVTDPNSSKSGINGKVQLDKELMEMNRNALQYETLTQFVSGSLRHLRMAITGQPQR